MANFETDAQFILFLVTFPEFSIGIGDVGSQAGPSAEIAVKAQRHAQSLAVPSNRVVLFFAGRGAQRKVGVSDGLGNRYITSSFGKNFVEIGIFIEGVIEVGGVGQVA